MPVLDPPPPDDNEGDNMSDTVLIEPEVVTPDDENTTAVPLTGDPAIDACRLLIDEAAHRNLFTATEIAEFMSSDVFADNPASQVLITEFREHPRGPSDNEHVAASLLIDFLLDLMNSCSEHVRV